MLRRIDLVAGLLVACTGIPGAATAALPTDAECESFTAIESERIAVTERVRETLAGRTGVLSGFDEADAAWREFRDRTASLSKAARAPCRCDELTALTAERIGQLGRWLDAETEDCTDGRD